MQSSQTRGNYVLKAVIGHSSIWVALGPYHTVMTFQRFTKAIFLRSLAGRVPPSSPPLPEFSLAASLRPGGQLHTSHGLLTKVPVTFCRNGRLLENRPWGREGRWKAVSNITWCHFHQQGSHWLRVGSIGKWLPRALLSRGPPIPTPTPTHRPQLPRVREEQRVRSHWTPLTHPNPSSCLSELHLHCELEP